MSLVYNPPIPFVAAIPNGFRPGMCLTIQGNVPYDANRFRISLMNGPFSKSSDIALCINLLFDDPNMTRNTRIALTWGDMETIKQPLARACPFEVNLVCDPCNILMMLNNKVLDPYPHRMPNDSMDFLAICGDVVVISISTKNALLPAIGCACFYLDGCTCNVPGGRGKPVVRKLTKWGPTINVNQDY